MTENIESVLFVCALGAPLLVFPLLIRKFPKAGDILVIVYLGIFYGLSLAGAYVVGNHGGCDWRRQWCPKCLVEEYVSFSGRTKTSISTIGALFWPCLVLDRLIWHRTTEADV